MSRRFGRSVIGTAERPLRVWAVALVCGGVALGAAASAPAPRLPALVFASRQPLEVGSGQQIPGLGPGGRTAAPGGKLLVREPSGRVRALLRESPFFDVSDPSVSWDGKRIAFAATLAPDSAWRIYAVDVDGRGLVAMTRSDRSLDLSPLGHAAPRFERYDDIDPCWLPDGRLCFATTRFPQVAQRGEFATTNLFAVEASGGRPMRVSSERNGAEEPTVDPRSGRLVYARWWFNRYLAANQAGGITTSAANAVPADSVNVWHAVSATPDGNGVRLAGGNPRRRAETMAYQPALLRDGTLIGVRAENLGLSPHPGRTRLQIFRGGFGPAREIPASAGRGSSCSPAVLPDGRILFSLDPGGGGDFGLYVVRPDGSGLRRVLDLPGTLELDAAPVVARPRPPVLPAVLREHPRQLPPMRIEELQDRVNTFRFDCLNVFANAAIDAPIADAPPLERDVRIRFFATLFRPDRPGGDTVVLVREARVKESGAVHEHDMPADVPMFEQLVDAHSRLLRSTAGPAHVSGLNSGRFGTGTQCVGCHAGHSTIPVPVSYSAGKRFNASPSAEVQASSLAPGNGARAVVDRRVRGQAARVAWIAGSARDQHVRLTWNTPIEVEAVVLYALPADPSAGTELQIRESQIVLLRRGQELERTVVHRTLTPGGIRAEFNGVRCDAVEVRLIEVTGQVLHRSAAALAEIETIARLEDP